MFIHCLLANGNKDVVWLYTSLFLVEFQILPSFHVQFERHWVIVMLLTHRWIITSVYRISFLRSQCRVDSELKIKLRMPWCVAVGCSNNKKETKDGKPLSYHRFPHSNPEILSKWINSMKRKGHSLGESYQPSKTSTICSQHFETHCLCMLLNVIPHLMCELEFHQDASQRTAVQCNKIFLVSPGNRGLCSQNDNKLKLSLWFLPCRYNLWSMGAIYWVIWVSSHFCFGLKWSCLNILLM